MSFVSPAQGQRVLHTHVTQLINALTGVSGAGEVLAFTALSNSSSYALDVRNLDGTNSYGLRVRDASDNVILVARKNTIQIGASAANDSLTINADIALPSGADIVWNSDVTLAYSSNLLTLSGGDLKIGTGTNVPFISLWGNAANAGERNFDWIANQDTQGGLSCRISTTNANAPSVTEFMIAGSGASRSVGGIRIGADSTNNLIDDASTGSGTATLYVGNASINVTSDSRLKSDIVDTARDAMALIRQLRVVDYAWNDPSDTAPVNRNSRGTWMGLVAQEAVDIVPWVVNAPDRTCVTCRAGQPCEDHPSFWQLQYEHLGGLFAKALQQVDARLTALEAA